MNRKSIENYLKNALQEEAPESVWDKIEKEQMAMRPRQNQKRRVVIRYSVVTSLTACMVIVLSVVLAQNGIFNPSEFTGDPTMNTEINQTPSQDINENDSQVTVPTPPAVVPPKDDGDTNLPPVSEWPEDGEIYNGICVGFFELFNHGLYRWREEIKITESELGEKYSDGDFEVFSIKGKPIEEAFAWKVNGGIQYFSCVDDGIIILDGVKYGLVKKDHRPLEKGKYLATVEGKAIYEAIGDDEAILVDMQTLLEGTEMDDIYGINSERLYVAKILE